MILNQKKNRCRILRTLAKEKKSTSLSKDQKEKYLSCTKKYMTAYLLMLTFGDERRAAFEEPDGWTRVWVHPGNNQTRHLARKLRCVLGLP